ncbi:DNA topoisomerase IB [Herbaspirillum sp. RV1423]|uniref:DNA topoisomerase IB n=1 Tax=Herbaspirillum sp. RV1423 TaxID=1443993 RepID=UPI0004B44A8A|nr:DNA topoisomerase IB [Herbaspirillum sp. RV1423]
MNQTGRTVKQLARESGLRYVNDDTPGIHRTRGHGSFVYTDSEGRPVRDEAEIARIEALAIPPAWEDVWICPWANGHIQATGRDARQRKQYRYHALWRSVRDEVKYQHMIAFAQALPQIRTCLERDLKKPGLNKRKILATVVYLLQATLMRIGNEEYARNNRSFGITTLNNRHVKADGADIKFHFHGKSGVQHTIKLHDPYMVRIVRKLLDLPGQELFQYVDEAGETHAIDSSDVNDYLRDVTGENYTAKDFRTWAGTVLAASALDEPRQFDSQAEARKNIVQAIAHVAKKLGNTPAICRKCYVHPDVISAYLDGVTVGQLKQQADDNPIGDIHALSPEEATVLALLQEQKKKKEGNKKKN